MDTKQVIVRTGLVSFVAANLLLAASLPSKAQIRLEMNQVTCGDFLGYSQESQDFVRYWMSGYYSAAANRNRGGVEIRAAERFAEIFLFGEFQFASPPGSRTDFARGTLRKFTLAFDITAGIDF